MKPISLARSILSSFYPSRTLTPLACRAFSFCTWLSSSRTPPSRVHVLHATALSALSSTPLCRAYIKGPLCIKICALSTSTETLKSWSRSHLCRAAITEEPPATEASSPSDFIVDSASPTVLQPALRSRARKLRRALLICSEEAPSHHRRVRSTSLGALRRSSHCRR